MLFFPPLSFFSLACDEKNELPPGTVGLTASTCSRLNWNAKGRTCRGLPKGNSPEPPQCCLFSLCLSPGHAIFKLTYLSNHDYKHLYFESDAATVNEIVLKVSAPPRARPQSLGLAAAASSRHWTRLPGPVCRAGAAFWSPRWGAPIPRATPQVSCPSPDSAKPGPPSASSHPLSGAPQGPWNGLRGNCCYWVKTLNVFRIILATCSTRIHLYATMVCYHVSAVLTENLLCASLVPGTLQGQTQALPPESSASVRGDRHETLQYKEIVKQSQRCHVDVEKVN